MEAGVSRRLGLAAAVAAASALLATSLVVSADSAESGVPAPDDLLPDLKVERPDELYVAKNRKETRLRVSNTISNTGTGPLEIEGDGASCDEGDGKRTIQRIFKDDPSHTASIGFFIRGADQASTPVQAGCSRYHENHDHWHFDNFARYTLYSERTGNPIGSSRKVSFCVIDTGRPYRNLAGSPKNPYYPQDEGNPQFPTCSATSTDGLSVGWEDTYGASLPGQAIKITGKRKGRYCLVIEADPPTADPDGVLDESDPGNNLREIQMRLNPRKAKVRRLGPDCAVDVSP